MPFKKGNIPYNKGKKGYARDIYTLSYYERNKDKIITRVVRKKEDRKVFKAGRPRTPFCEACGKVCRVYFDHDHKTNKFRGWICRECNSALGYTYDNPAILQALAHYIMKHNAVEQLKNKYQVVIGFGGQVLDVKPLPQ